MLRITRGSVKSYGIALQRFDDTRAGVSLQPLWLGNQTGPTSGLPRSLDGVETETLNGGWPPFRAPAH